MTWRETSYQLTCHDTGLEHAITVSLPFRYDQLEAAPVIVCLDGPWLAGTVRDACRVMSMADDAPEAIVVGVGFTDDSMSEFLRQRARWYTPTQWVPPEETGVHGLVAEECGQADKLRGFLRQQLLPELADEYRISERWYAGHSYTGLFGLAAVFSEPDLFDRWLLASPSIWWHDRSILDIESEYSRTHQDLATTVFLSAGTDEDLRDDEADQPAYDQLGRMKANVDDLHARLVGRNYPSLQLFHGVMQGENHSSTIGAAVSHGLRALHHGRYPTHSP